MLPLALQNAIHIRLQEKSGLNAGVVSLTKTYQRGGVSSPTMDFSAYLAARLPATFAAMQVCLNEAARIAADFAPTSMLDVGAGPGTASWAAVDVWPSLSALTLIDNNQNFLNLARELASHSPSPALHQATFTEANILNLTAQKKFDLVAVCYALAELRDTEISDAVSRLWSATEKLLIIVEPGSKHGFARIAAARQALLAQNANLLAPCGHQSTCPMAKDDWCHFTVRLPRSRAHLHAKQASVPFEDEPYAYLVASRTAYSASGARILTRPLDTKPSRTFKLCTPTGIVTRTIATRDKAAYKASRKLAWGDRLPTKE